MEIALTRNTATAFASVPKVLTTMLAGGEIPYSQASKENYICCYPTYTMSCIFVINYHLRGQG